MILNRHGREFYAVRITTEPPIPAGSWEASFDKGSTWHPATVQTDATGDWSAWLLAGSSAARGDAVAVLQVGAHTPLLRAVDTTEIVVPADKVPTVNVR